MRPAAACGLEGPCFLHILAPCPTGWRHDSADTVALSRLAVETGMFVLWEFEGHNLKDIKLSRKPKERKPVLEYLTRRTSVSLVHGPPCLGGLRPPSEAQGRFRHLLKQSEVLAQIQKDVDEQARSLGSESSAHKSPIAQRKGRGFREEDRAPRQSARSSESATNESVAIRS